MKKNQVSTYLPGTGSFEHFSGTRIPTNMISKFKTLHIFKHYSYLCKEENILFFIIIIMGPKTIFKKRGPKIELSKRLTDSGGIPVWFLYALRQISR